MFLIELDFPIVFIELFTKCAIFYVCKIASHLFFLRKIASHLFQHKIDSE